MSQSAGRIDLDLGINYRQFNREMNGIAGTAQGMAMGAFKKLGFMIGAAFTTAALVKFGKEATLLASNLEEVQNVVDVTFRDMAGEINNFSKNALEKFGMSELSAKKFSSTIGAMLKSSGVNGKQMVGMSKSITALTGDMASFYNLKHEEAFLKIRAGISGETEPLRQLGINMTVANLEAYALSKGIRKSYQEMSQAEQVLLRYNYLMQNTTDAQGDFARTSGSWANQVRLMSEQWKIFMQTMGSGFINMLTPVIRGLNLLIQKLQIAAQYFKAFTEIVFGAQQQTAKGAAEAAVASVALNNMADASKDAGKGIGKAGKEVKGSLGAFDQLNVLTQNTMDAMAGISDEGSNIDMGMEEGTNSDVKIDTTKLDVVIEKLGIIKNFAKDIGTFLGEAFGPSFATMLQVAKDMFDGIKESAIMVGQTFYEAWKPIIEWFATNGVGIINEFLRIATDLWWGLFTTVKTVFDTIWKVVIAPIMMLISRIVVDTLNALQKFWENHGNNLIKNVSETFNVLKTHFMTLWKVYLEPIITGMLEMFTWLWEKHLKGLVDEILDFVGIVVNAALEIINKFIIPLWTALVKTLYPAFANAIGFAIDIVGTLLGVVSDVAGGLLKALGGIIEFLMGVFTGDWKRAWEGITNIFKGIVNGWAGIVKGVINIVIDAMNFLIRGMNKLKFTAPDWVPKIGGKSIGVNLSTIPKLATGGIVTQPTLAMMGENSKKEAVIPLENSSFIMNFAAEVAKAVAMALSQSQGKQSDYPEEIVLKVGETEFGRIAIKGINAVQRQMGVTMITI